MITKYVLILQVYIKFSNYWLFLLFISDDDVQFIALIIIFIPTPVEQIGLSMVNRVK